MHTHRKGNLQGFFVPKHASIVCKRSHGVHVGIQLLAGFELFASVWRHDVHKRPA